MNNNAIQGDWKRI